MSLLSKYFGWLEFIVHLELPFVLHKLHFELCRGCHCMSDIEACLFASKQSLSNPQSLFKSIGHMTQYRVDLDHIVVFSGKTSNIKNLHVLKILHSRFYLLTKHMFHYEMVTFKILLEKTIWVVLLQNLDDHQTFIPFTHIGSHCTFISHYPFILSNTTFMFHTVILCKTKWNCHPFLDQ